MSTRRLLLLVACALGACDPTSFGPSPAPTDTAAVIDAGVTPRPLEDPRLDGGLAGRPGDAGPADAGDAAPPPPESLDPARPLPGERLRGMLWNGVALDVAVRWRDVPGPPNLSEVNVDAVRAASREASGRMRVLLATSGRMRVDVESRGMLLPKGTVMVARLDRYGHVMLWPGSRRYRVIPPGSARALFGEGRADVGQVARGSTTATTAGERLGLETRRVQLTSPLGSVELELASLPALGAGGQLFCRLLLDIAGIDPSSDVCEGDELPLAADYRWHAGGSGVRFEVASLGNLDNLQSEPFAMPPRRARFLASGLPERPEVFFTSDELSTFRSKPIEVTPGPDAPQVGMAASNRSDLTMFLLLDGVSTAAVGPWKTVMIPGLEPGRYTLQWRSFLGDRVGEVSEQVVPSRITYGKPLPEAGADAGP